MALRLYRLYGGGLPLFFVICLLILSYDHMDSTKIVFSESISSTKLTRILSNFVPINPFKTPSKSIHDIMLAYSFNDFDASPASVKHILFWNEAYGSKDYGEFTVLKDFRGIKKSIQGDRRYQRFSVFTLSQTSGVGLGEAGFRQLNCPLQCLATENRSFLPSVDAFDAIVFHFRTFNKEDLPTKRHPRQRWIFWSLESPQYAMQNVEPLNGLFNWTMTYRLGSDVIQPYGWVEPLSLFETSAKSANNSHPVMIGRNFALNKNKLVAWFVSNCESKSLRENYVNALAKHIPIDVYGSCGPLRCNRNDMGGCYEMLDRSYKFYLSFENSFCDDYVTEKLFSILELDVVPVVFGGADYSLFAPPLSFIDARNFKSALELAKYLRILDADDSKYNAYFKWKNQFKIRNKVVDLQLAMCGLCARLHTDTSVKVYEDLEKWWIRDSHCKIPRVDSVFRIPAWHN